MPFTLIKGTFHVKGYSPDGDSIRFKANNGANWVKLRCPYVELNGRDHAQLRLEGIDTLETHYGGFHQPLALAEDAMSLLLNLLGITNVEWDLLRNPPQIVRAADGTSGYILTRKADQNHRPIAFAFAGETILKDGDEKVVLDPALLRQSVNYQILAAGLAYPMYYQGLFSDLRDTFTQAVQTARAVPSGVWQQDRTIGGFELRDIRAVTEEFVIWPKLFRRVVNYFGNGGRLDKFKKFLDTNPDALLQLGRCHFTHLSTFVTVENRVVRMTEATENLVFLE